MPVGRCSGAGCELDNMILDFIYQVDYGYLKGTSSMDDNI